LKSLLITGGCGFIGSHFVKLVRRERPDCRIVNLDLLTYAGNPENVSVLTEESSVYRFVQGDISDPLLVDQVFTSERFDAVVNFAAETHVDRSLLDSAPFLRTNVEGARVLFETASRHGVNRFLQISTDEVYGSLSATNPPFTEDSPLQPNSPYAASKAAADLLARAYYRSYGLPVLITRCGNNYGPYQFPEKFLPLFITHALDNQPLPLYGDGQQVRDWIHVQDHVQAVLLVLEQGTPGEIYNISADGERTNQHMAEWVLDMLKKPRDLIQHVKDRPGHDRRYALSAVKIRRDLGWRPSIPLSEGVHSTIEWYRAERSWWERIKRGEYKRYFEQWYAERMANRSDESTSS
jgi:dTDP-glucose 4,6-dehydratase